MMRLANFLFNKPRLWPVRLYLNLNGILVSLVALFEPKSLNAIAFANTPDSAFVPVLLLIINIICLCDIFINDLFKINSYFCNVRKIRYLIYAVLALINVSISFVMIKSLGLNFVAGRYCLDGMFSMMIAYLDIHLKNQERRILT